MSRATSEDQLRFLLSCVQHSNNGRVDFVEVARECGVVSKGAAAKRYERLLKANGISAGTPGAAAAAAENISAVKSVKHKAKEPSDKSSVVKKRKLANGDSVAGEQDIKRAKSTRGASEAAALPTAFRSNVGHDFHNQGMTNGPPHLNGGPSLYMMRPPPMGLGVPPYALQQHPGHPGFNPYHHAMTQEMPLYHPFVPANFREPWNAPAPAFDIDFKNYGGPGYVSHQQNIDQLSLDLEPLPLRGPPPPQEVVFMQPEGAEEVEAEKEELLVGERHVVVE